jgi:hypothetical protein
LIAMLFGAESFVSTTPSLIDGLQCRFSGTGL